MRNSAVWAAMVAGVMCALSAKQVLAQVNSGSDGSDGALNPTSNLVIDMADHPDGIYQYSLVNIPSGVTVSFLPNAANTPVVWLVQGSCTIAGTLNVRGKDIDRSIYGASGAPGGPGGYRGGNAGLGGGTPDPGPGFGPGGGKVTAEMSGWLGGNASYGAIGGSSPSHATQHPAGEVYGSVSLLPLLGGSGGGGGQAYGGATYKNGGGGGGGAILIAASANIVLSGTIDASGGGAGAYSACSNSVNYTGGGAGSGGAVRLIASTLTGSGSINTSGHYARYYWQGGCYSSGSGTGRIRLEGFADTFSGPTTGVITRGLQGVILLPSNQEPRLSISSVAGTAIPNPPTGVAATPDVIIPGQQANPIAIGVMCENIPLNSDIIVDVKPYNGAGVSATGQNTTGTTASSTATISINMPTGGGTIQARTTANIVLASGKDGRRTLKKPSLFESGLAMNGERFRAAEITSALGGRQELVFVTESGKRIAASATGRDRSERKPSTRPS